MKKILLLIISVLLLSCGTRQKEKQTFQNDKFTEAALSGSSGTRLQIERKDADLQVTDLSRTKISVIPRLDKCIGSGIGFDPGQARQMTVKDAKGNETVIPVNENSEISIDNTSEISLKLKMTELELADAKKENLNLNLKNKELLQAAQITVKSSKPMWWIYPLLFLCGVAFLPILKYFIKR